MGGTPHFRLVRGRPAPMLPRHNTRFLLCFGGLLIWSWFTWPLPRHFGQAIPWTDRLHEGGSRVRELVPGDHLQLYYHFWLARDMLAGHTEAFRPPYEFNMGEEHRVWRFDPGYLPFSLVYAVAAPGLGGPAAWNLAGLASVLLGLFGVFRLVQRYADSRATAIGIALLTTAFPYRWITLLGGSPTGYGMGLIPWLLAGLDHAIRDRRPSGGVIAGLALLGAYATDLHCFYFASLLTPLWCLIAWSAAGALSFPRGRVRGTLAALLPTLLFAGLALGLSMLASRHLAVTDMAAGRSWSDVKLFSPIPSGLFRRQPLGPSNHIYTGVALALLTAGAVLFHGFSRWRRHATQPTPRQPSSGAEAPLWLPPVLILGLAGLVLLALGTNGPAGGLPLRLARRLLPKFTMIRQSPKLFCLVPSLLAVLLAVLLAPLAAMPARPRRRWLALFAGLGLAAVAETGLWFRAGLCALPGGMPAYAAVRAHAAARGVRHPHALALPLWPGDSHYSSVYEYGIIHSRVRLLNGYSPAIPDGYRERVLNPLDSLNHGVLYAAQIAHLRELGVGYLLFHEQPYPEKVSLFPSAIALRRLLQHPWLDPLAVDGPNRTFAIRDTPRGAAEIPELWEPPRYLPARHWTPRRQPTTGGAAFAFPLTLRSPAAPAPALRYLLRVAGGGTLVSDTGTRLDVPVEPVWIETPLTSPSGDTWRVSSGLPRLEHALIIAGEVDGTLTNGHGRWAAADLFHRGTTDTRTGRVRLDPVRVAQGLALYGPCLPVPPGRYRGTLVTEPERPSDTGTELGRLLAVTMGDPVQTLAAVPVTAGRPATCEFDYDGSRPLRMEFHYHRRQPVQLVALELVPLPPTP